MIIERRYSLDAVAPVAMDLAAFASDCDTLTFTGSLGAGKTTLIRHLLADWGVLSGVTSPTFTYMQRYILPSGVTVYHFDLYRLSRQDAFFELGLNEYLTQEKSKILIEWPAMIADLLRGKICHVTLEYPADEMESRSLRAVKEEC